MTAEAVRTALGRVVDPEIRRPITELDMVKSVDIDGPVVSVTIWLTVAACPMRDRLTTDVTTAVSQVAGVERVEVVLDVMSDDQRAALKEKLRGPHVVHSAPVQWTWS